MTTKPALTLRLAAPRGFCAGVDRAIQIVEEALKKWGAPVYVRHEIVHNRHVVERLEDLGAIFVEELEECPDDRPVISWDTLRGRAWGDRRSPPPGAPMSRVALRGLVQRALGPVGHGGRAAGRWRPATRVRGLRRGFSSIW